MQNVEFFLLTHWLKCGKIGPLTSEPARSPQRAHDTPYGKILLTRRTRTKNPIFPEIAHPANTYTHAICSRSYHTSLARSTKFLGQTFLSIEIFTILYNKISWTKMFPQFIISHFLAFVNRNFPGQKKIIVFLHYNI